MSKLNPGQDLLRARKLLLQALTRFKTQRNLKDKRKKLRSHQRKYRSQIKTLRKSQIKPVLETEMQKTIKIDLSRQKHLRQPISLKK